MAPSQPEATTVSVPAHSTGSRIDRSKYKLLRNTGADDVEDYDVLVSGRSSDTSRAIESALEKLTKNNHKTIRIRGRGRACTTVVEVAEVVRWNMPNLYKSVKVGVTEQDQEYVPVTESSSPTTDALSIHRKVSYLEITLSTEPGKAPEAQGYCENCSAEEAASNLANYRQSTAQTHSRSEIKQ